MIKEWTIRQNSSYIGTIYHNTVTGEYETEGTIGYNYYGSIEDLILGLQGMGISFDDVYV